MGHQPLGAAGDAGAPSVNFVPRRDGGVYQVLGDSDYCGFGDDTTLPSRAEAEGAVNSIATPFT